MKSRLFRAKIYDVISFVSIGFKDDNNPHVVKVTFLQNGFEDKPITGASRKNDENRYIECIADKNLRIEIE